MTHPRAYVKIMTTTPEGEAGPTYDFAMIITEGSSDEDIAKTAQSTARMLTILRDTGFNPPTSV